MILLNLYLRNVVRVCIGVALAISVSVLGQPLRGGTDNPSRQKKVTVQPRLSHDNVHPGSIIYALLVVNIQDGWHINSALPADENIIPTTIDIQKGTVLDSIEIRFPKGVERMFGFSETPLDVYEGTEQVLISFRIAADVKPGTYPIPASFSYQACSNKVCLAPAAEKFDIVLHVVQETEKMSRINRELFERYEEVPKD